VTLLAQLSHDERLAQLAGEAADRRFANLRPVDAATLIILDRSAREPRVLMGKRHSAHKFMPGKFVFPGGRIDKADANVPLAQDLSLELARALMLRAQRPSLVQARRLALCALRETFEETGIVIGAQAGTIAGESWAPKIPKLWRDFCATSFLPDLSALTFVARAITPPRRPKRFDTRFFVVDRSAISHQVEGCVGPETELTELAWLSLKETADLPLPAITRVILAELDHWSATKAGQNGAQGQTAIPFYFERHRRFQRDMLET
jgi:8-oxo-dGTP pyrophosphatase MutT (NUDIX family)